MVNKIGRGFQVLHTILGLYSLVFLILMIIGVTAWSPWGLIILTGSVVANYIMFMVWQEWIEERRAFDRKYNLEPITMWREYQ